MSPKPRSAYGYPNFRRLWLSQVISKAGSNLTEVALAVFALQVSGGQPMAYAGVLFLDMLPAVALGWLAGVLVDRFNKRRLLIAADLLRAVLVASVPVIGQLWWAYAVIFLSQTADLLYKPALKALLPETVPSSMLLGANSAISAGTSGISVPAYMVGAGLLLQVGLLPTFLGDAASFVLAGATLLTLTLSPAILMPSASQTSHGFWSEFQAGIVYHLRTPIVWRLLSLFMMGSLGLIGVNVLSAILVPRLLHRPEGTLGWLLAALALGMWAGSLMVGYAHIAVHHFRHIVAGAFTAVGFSLALLGQSHQLGWDLGLYAAIGLANAALVVTVNVWIQSIVPREMRGRVYAARSAGLGLGGAVSVLLAGLMTETLGVTPSLTVMAIFVVGVGILSAMWLRPAVSQAFPAANIHD